jgi:RNA polymerase sigma-70 factor (ECF subfamily)
LWSAAQARDVGPFQLEAAIQSAHCHRLVTGTTPWPAIADLYGQINRHFPTLGSQVAGAVAVAEAGDAPAGLAQLLAIEPEPMRSFQPFWVARAHVLTLLGQVPEAVAAYGVAIGLCTQERLRVYLQARRRALLH